MAPFSAIWRVVGRVRDILTVFPPSPSAAATPGETRPTAAAAPVSNGVVQRTIAAPVPRTAFYAKPAKVAKSTLKWLAGRASPVSGRATNAVEAQVAVSPFKSKSFFATRWTAAMVRSIQTKTRIYSRPVALPQASLSRVHAPTITQDPITPVNLTSAPSTITSSAGADPTFTSETQDHTPPLTATSSSFDSTSPPSPSRSAHRLPLSLSLIVQPRTTTLLDVSSLDADYDLRESGISGKFGASIDQSAKGTLGHGYTSIGFLDAEGALGDSFGDVGPEDIDLVLVDANVNEPWLDKPINAPPVSARTGQVDDEEFRYVEDEEMDDEDEPQSFLEDPQPVTRQGFDPQSSIARVEDWVLADLAQMISPVDEPMSNASIDAHFITQLPPDEYLAVESDPQELDATAETPEAPITEALSPLTEASVEADVVTEPTSPSPKPAELLTTLSSPSSSPITDSAVSSSPSVTPSVAPSVSDSSSPRPRFQGIQSLVERRISHVQSKGSPPSASAAPAAPPGRDAFRRAVLQIHTLRNFSSLRVPSPQPAPINPETMRKATTRSMRKFGDIVEQERKAVEEMKASLAAIKEANQPKLSTGAKDVTPPSSTKLSAVPSLPVVLEHEPPQKVLSPVHRQVQLIAREVSEEPKKVGKPDVPPPRKSQSMSKTYSQPPEEKRAAAEPLSAPQPASMLLTEPPKATLFENGNLPSPFTEPENLSPEPSPPPAPRQRQLSNGSPMNLFQRQMLQIAKEGGPNFNAGTGKENGSPTLAGEVENAVPTTRSRRRRASNNTASISSTVSPSYQSPPSYASVAKPAAPQPPPPSRVPTRPAPRRAATVSEQRPPRAQQQQQQQQQGQQPPYSRPGPNAAYKQGGAPYKSNGQGYGQPAPGQNYGPPMNNYAPPPPQRSFNPRSNAPHYPSASEPPARNQSFQQRPGQAQPQPASRPNPYSQPSQPSQPQRSQTIRNRRPRQPTFAT